MKYQVGDKFILKRWPHIVPVLERYEGNGMWVVRWYNKSGRSWTSDWTEKGMDKSFTPIEKPTVECELPEGLFEI